jgi:hypothetical protein
MNLFICLKSIAHLPKNQNKCWAFFQDKISVDCEIKIKSVIIISVGE